MKKVIFLISLFVAFSAQAKDEKITGEQVVDTAPQPSLLAKKETIRSIDFRNYTYTNFVGETVTLKDGKFVNPDDAIEETHLNLVQYVDFNNDGEEEAVVSIGTSVNGALVYGENYLVYSYPQGQVKEIFKTGRTLANEMKVDGNTIVIKAPDWRGGENPTCCPSRMETAVYGWKEGKIQLLSKNFAVNEETLQAQKETEQTTASDNSHISPTYPVCGSSKRNDYIPNINIEPKNRRNAIIERIGSGCSIFAGNDFVAFASYQSGASLLLTNAKCVAKGEDWYFVQLILSDGQDNPLIICAKVGKYELKMSSFNFETSSYTTKETTIDLSDFIPMDYTPKQVGRNRR